MEIYTICFLATLSIIFVFGGLYYYYLSTGNFVQIRDEQESEDQESVRDNTV